MERLSESMKILLFTQLFRVFTLEYVKQCFDNSNSKESSQILVRISALLDLLVITKHEVSK